MIPMSLPTRFLISHDLAVVAEAALATGDTAWFLGGVQGSVIDRRYEMRISDLMGLSVMLGEAIGIQRERGEPFIAADKANEIRAQAFEEERASHGAPPRLEMGTIHRRLYRAAFAESRHRHCRDTLTVWQNVRNQPGLTEAAAVVALVGLGSPAPMTDIRLRALTMEMGFGASAARRAEQYGMIKLDGEGIYRVTPELENLIPWTSPSASDPHR